MSHSAVTSCESTTIANLSRFAIGASLPARGIALLQAGCPRSIMVCAESMKWESWRFMQEIGIVRAIYRYPVKSMAGELLESAALGWHGVEDDRRFAFRRFGVESGFPWLTASKLPSMLRYQAYYSPNAAPRVITPAGADLDLHDQALAGELAQAHGQDVQVMRLDHGIYDEAKLSLISTATIAGLEVAAGRPLDPRRFRPNLLIEPADSRPFVEDEWAGQVLVFGAAAGAPAMHVTMRDLRCVMVNFDPDTATADPRVLKAAARLNQTYAGVYGSTFRTGTIAPGDRVFLLAV